MAGQQTNSQAVGAGGRRGDIQGLRAVAVLLVVVYHADLGFSGGFVGVDVFFVISGYVITRALTAELGRTDRVSLRRFYLRRIRRLLPALGLMLTVVMLASSLLAPIGGQQITARTGAAAALFNANTYLMRFGGEGGYFDIDANLNALLHTWSLSVEEQFYFVFPAALFGAWILGRRVTRVGNRAAVAIVLALVSTVSFVLSWMLTTGRSGFLGVDAVNDLSGEVAFYSSFTRAWEFAVGGLLVMASPRLSNLARRSEWTLSIVGVVLIGYAALRFDELTPFPGTAALVPVVGTLCILAAGEGQPVNLVSKGLAVRPAQLLGDLSYSWYLWHWPFIVFAAALWPRAPWVLVVGAALSILPAWLSYRFVEQPIRFSPGTTQRTLLLASACIMLPIGAAVVLNEAHRVVNELVSEGRRKHADVDNGCNNAVPIGDLDRQSCTWVSNGSSRTAVLIGDSNAGHFTEAFLGAANANGITATVAVAVGCPFVDVINIDQGERGNSCRSFVEDSTVELARTRPDLVVIASSSSQYIESDRWTFEDPVTGNASKTPEEKARLWTEALTRTIKPLTDAGIEVVVVHVVPIIPFGPRECSALGVIINGGLCFPSATLEEADEFRQRAVQAELVAAARAGATTLDVAGELCPDGVCVTRRDGTWIWKDSTHISVDASVMLIPVFSTLFEI
jgi:peptidoglycan/LPS O-acetylase OafA/YrhL